MTITQRYRNAFITHFHNAKKRNIPFLFTFEEWLSIWLESGKWNERGSNRGQYVMARFGDKGAYEAGNVYICLAEDNRAERNKNYPMQGDNNPAFGKNYWSDISNEEYNRRAAITRELGLLPKSNSTKSKMSDAATGRKLVYRNGKRTWARPGDDDYPGVN